MAAQQKKSTGNTEQGLVIGKKTKSNLSKAQQAFNKLNQKIKKLRNDVITRTAHVDECLAYYSANIYTLEQGLVPVRSEVIKLLFNVYSTDKSLSKKDKKALKEVLLIQIDEVFGSTDQHDEELKKIFNVVSGENYDEVANSMFNDARDDAEQMFAEMGIDIDLSDFSKDDDIETVMRKMQEKLEGAKEGGDKKENTAGPKKSKRDLVREAKEKELETTREQSVKNIYRQLVKALHPDLERNDALRDEKEALMKELTIAYKDNDLHTLLKLELNWIQHESNHLETLTDEKLKIYNDLLKEQVQDLEDELFDISQHPRYMPLERFYTYGHLHMETLKAEPRRLKEIMKSIEASLHNLKNGKVKQEITEVVEAFHFQAKISKQMGKGWDDFF